MALADELTARLGAWAELRSLHDAGLPDAAAVNARRAADLRVFYGGRGIWTDKARTSRLAKDGVTVGVLHTGRLYADDLSPDGIVYHYPRTSAPGVISERATKAAKGLNLPLFVVVQPGLFVSACGAPRRRSARWVGEAEVPPDDIALLTAHAKHRSALWRVDALGGILLTDDPWERNPYFRCSIFRFKGLERMVVGLCELDGAREQALYVGLAT